MEAGGREGELDIRRRKNYLKFNGAELRVGYRGFCVTKDATSVKKKIFD